MESTPWKGLGFSPVDRSLPGRSQEYRSAERLGPFSALTRLLFFRNRAEYPVVRIPFRSTSENSTSLCRVEVAEVTALDSLVTAGQTSPVTRGLEAIEQLRGFQLTERAKNGH